MILIIFDEFSISHRYCFQRSDVIALDETKLTKVLRYFPSTMDFQNKIHMLEGMK